MTRAEIASLEAYPLRFDLPDDLLRRMLHSGERKYFQEGYEAAEKDIGWNSVDKSLPPMGEEVIVLTNEMNGHELPDASHLCFAHRPDPEVAVCYDGWNIPGVKYWMYCPKLPEK